jgi:NAD-dependent SIR2 family protein deacetylase
MKHHLIKESWHIEGNEVRCTYCGSQIAFEPEHHCSMNYKTAVCKCGKKIVMKMDFHGSGHDNHIKSKLEEKLKI